MEYAICRKIIKNYIAYNSFDIDRMLSDIHDDIKFENISNGEINLEISGIAELRKVRTSQKIFFKKTKADNYGN